MGYLTGLLEAAGALLFSYSLFMVAPFLGVAMAAIFLFTLGWVLDGGTISVPQRANKTEDDDLNGTP